MQDLIAKMELLESQTAVQLEAHSPPPIKARPPARPTALPACLHKLRVEV